MTFAFVFLQAAGGSAGSLVALLPIILVFAIFYFLLILPSQRSRKSLQKMLSELKPGDRVITSGGLRGTILNLRDDVVQIRVAPDQVKLEISRGAITQKLKEEA